MGFYTDNVLPRIVNLVCGTGEHAKLRERVCSDLDGEVLEVGFGSGLNVPHLPDDVTRLHAVDPATLGRKLASKRLAETTVPVEFVGLDGELLPLEDESVDHVLSTWTLCTIPDAEQAMREVRRVLKPGGTFHFLEHGRSPEPNVARWQDRLNPIQKKLGGGCNLNRPISEIVASSGLRMDGVENFYMKGPKPLVYQYEGTATKA